MVGVDQTKMVNSEYSKYHVAGALTGGVGLGLLIGLMILRRRQPVKTTRSLHVCISKRYSN